MTAPFRLSLVIMSLAPALAACSAGEDQVADREATNEVSEVSETEKGILTEARVALSETGWVTVGRDGAVYTTHLDANGQYRDFRNGNFLQSGIWQRGEEGQLCFVPDAPDRSGACWELDPRNDAGVVLAKRTDGSADDRTIELRRVSYLPPAASSSADRSDQTDGGGDDAAPNDSES